MLWHSESLNGENVSTYTYFLMNKWFMKAFFVVYCKHGVEGVGKLIQIVGTAKSKGVMSPPSILHVIYFTNQESTLQSTFINVK